MPWSLEVPRLPRNCPSPLSRASPFRSLPPAFPDDLQQLTPVTVLHDLECGSFVKQISWASGEFLEGLYNIQTCALYLYVWKIHMYTHTYIHMYIYIYIYIYAYTYTHTHAHVRTYIHTYIHTYLRTYLRTYACTCVYTYIHIHVYVTFLLGSV